MKKTYSNLLELRHAFGIPQVDLGWNQAISDIEHGKKMPGLALLKSMVKRLKKHGVTITEPELFQLCQNHFMTPTK